MNTIYRLTTLFALTLSVLGADVKFSALPTATSPSTNSYLPIIDLNLLPAAQNQKYLLTNLANATPSGITNALGISTTPTELQYVSGVTSAIQAQIDGKQPKVATLTTSWSAASAATNFVVDLSVPYLQWMMTTNLNLAHTTNGTANFTASTVQSQGLTVINNSGTNFTIAWPATWKSIGTIATSPITLTNGDYCSIAIQFAGSTTSQTNNWIGVAYKNF